MHLWLGKGEVQIENCRGAFSVTSGNADVRVKHFIEIETPEVPPLPKEERHIRMDDPESWEEWGENGRNGEEKSGKSFYGGFFGQTTGTNPGVNIQTGKGDMNLEEINAKTCIIRAAKGDAKVEAGKGREPRYEGYQRGY